MTYPNIYSPPLSSLLEEAHHGIGDIIAMIKPDVMIFSSSTTDVPQADIENYKQHCGEIVILPPQGVTTTTARVRNLTIEGAETLAKEVTELIEKFLNNIRQS